eukprot:CAMPEP_0178900494 /NCGR_PEP_ID=MMETSP0786-20121207/3504_1 /TAXON_ID=186022 /ORGANISM="Thalassionema frauenfeldii, Strain CCMP 1798" /LENGTH=903 /DNA_ID=CAMNT_0020571503 /DNA_START=229 /DNA_END=2940 /DNA_ORIENTATION=-
MRQLRAIVPLILFGSAQIILGSDVRQNSGNCVGVKSCRPRCMTFKIGREIHTCGTSEGIFNVQGDVNPWDMKRFTTRNCAQTNTCDNDLCGEELFGDLTVRVGEQGHRGSYFYTAFDLPKGGLDRFTFCSMYPCTKEECALPEQMGFELQFSFFKGLLEVGDLTQNPMLEVEFHLKASFIGTPLTPDAINRYGPIHVEWMDDPAGCRPGALSNYTPIAPSPDQQVSTDNPPFELSLYCEGEIYEPRDLPRVQPTDEPSLLPSLSPSMSFHPSPYPTHSAIGEEQLSGLRSLYDSTLMSSAVSRDKHNWFTTADYCSFTGVVCDTRRYVIIVDLTNMRLAGELPTSFEKLIHLRQLKLVNNRIAGNIPEQLCKNQDLTQLELGSNHFTGKIPTCLHRLRHLRRLMLQYNYLEGNIPHEFCRVNGLSSFDISGNLGMYGEIPQCMGNLRLSILRVENVGLVGQVPPLLCTGQPINGLDPNPYGCDAIACPAGTFEPTAGRKVDDPRECLPCSVPSNVIGSTTCLYVENNTVISATPLPSVMPLKSSEPTTLPSTNPSMVLDSGFPSISPTSMEGSPAPSLPGNLSDFPTSVPSEVRSDSDSPSTSSAPVSAHPSFLHYHSTERPSFTPTLQTPTPSSMPSINLATLPSSLPSIHPSGREVVVITTFFATVQIKLDKDMRNIFESVTSSQIQSNTTAIYRITVLSQSITNASSINSSRRLLSGLAIETEIEGWSKTKTLEETVHEIVIEGFSDYSKMLFAAIPSLMPSGPTPGPTPGPFKRFSQPEIIMDDKRRPNWVLLGSAVALSVIAVFAVLFVRHSRITTRAGVDNRVRRSSAFPTSSSSRIYDRESLPDDDLSAESSSGWNSESSPGEFVNDQAVQDWTSTQKDTDIKMMSKDNVFEEQLI